MGNTVGCGGTLKSSFANVIPNSELSSLPVLPVQFVTCSLLSFVNVGANQEEFWSNCFPAEGIRTVIKLSSPRFLVAHLALVAKCLNVLKPVFVFRNMYCVWRAYLEGTVQATQSRITTCDNYKVQVADAAKMARLQKEQQLRKVMQFLNSAQVSGTCVLTAVCMSVLMQSRV